MNNLTAKPAAAEDDDWGAIEMGLRGALIAAQGRNPTTTRMMLEVVMDLVGKVTPS